MNIYIYIYIYIYQTLRMGEIKDRQRNPRHIYY